MAYDALVRRLTKRAFVLAGDLAVTAQLSQSTPKGFDFVSGLPKVGFNDALSVKGFLRERAVVAAEGAKQTVLVVLAEGLKDPSGYDTVITEGKGISQKWTVIAPFETNGFTTTLQLRRA